MKFYHLSGKDRSASFSPYGWRAKLFLLHKGISFEEESLHFSELSKLAHAPKQSVPTIEDGDRVISDSFAIAEYLEDTYPEPDLFGGPVARAQAAAFNKYIDSIVVVSIFGHVILDIHAQLDPESQAYFRKTREVRIGMTLEEFHAARGQDLTALTRSLEPFRATLANGPFLSGESPKWLDYTLMGTLIWPHVISNKVLIAEDDPLHGWRDRMFGLFDGAIGNVPRAVD